MMLFFCVIRVNRQIFSLHGFPGARNDGVYSSLMYGCCWSLILSYNPLKLLRLMAACFGWKRLIWLDFYRRTCALRPCVTSFSAGSRTIASGVPPRTSDPLAGSIRERKKNSK